MEDGLIGRRTPLVVSKYDGTHHSRWPTRFVARKGPLYLTALSVGDEIERLDPKRGQVRWACEWPGDVYLFDDRWWNASRLKRDGRTWYYVNAATPVEFDGAQFHCVDLDLDVSWYPGEAPRVLDEDEFLAHGEAMGYPADVIERARGAVDEVLGLIGRRAFPFDRP
jgi:protein associated with RNAse G/E